MALNNRIGVLALQGAFAKHIEMLESLGWRTSQVKTPEDLNLVDALIIPGGESTTMGKLLTENSMMTPLHDLVKSGMPIFGTCAGMIILAQRISGSDQPHLSAIAIEVERNAYGRQKESFEASFKVNNLPGPEFTGVFIRAPRIVSVSPGVEVMAEFEGAPIMVRQGNILASSFHPELTSDARVHEFFISMINGHVKKTGKSA
jgi:5'-phosphate synthase pdxT subunit